MDAQTIAASLVAYVDHLDTHPDLAEVVSTSSLSQFRHYGQAHLAVTVFDHVRGSLGALAAWVRTLHHAGEVTVRTANGHVHVVAELADKTKIAVQGALGDDEVGLLRANGVQEGAFAVELLLRLASAADAEAVAR